MKVKKWLFGIIMLAFGITATVVGVYSASISNTFAISGQIKFSTTNCSVSVDCDINNVADGVNATNKHYKTMVSSTATTTTRGLDVGTVNFVTNSGETEPITVELTVTNTSSTPVKGTINVDPDGELTGKVTFKCDRYNILPYTFEMNTDEEITFKITYTLNASTNLNVDFGISLKFEKFTPPTAEELTTAGYVLSYVGESQMYGQPDLYNYNLLGVPQCSSETLEIVIPKLVTHTDGTIKQITCLGDYVFDEDYYYGIGNQITNIGSYAYVVVQPGVEYIGHYAFSDMTTGVGDDGSYCYISLPNTVVAIGYNAFKYNGGAYAYVNVPSSVITLNYYAYQDVYIVDTQIEDLANWNANCTYDAFDITDTLNKFCFNGCSASFIDSDGTLDLTPLKNLKTVGGFGGLSIKSVKLPYGVEKISPYAFANCYSLTSIDIPESVTYVGEYAFELCESLETLVIPKSVEYQGQGMLGGCLHLTDLTIPFCGRDLTSYNSSYDIPSMYFLFGSYKYPNGSYTSDASSGVTTANDNDTTYTVGTYRYIMNGRSKKAAVPNSLTTVEITNAKRITTMAFQRFPVEYVYFNKEVHLIGRSAFGFCKRLRYVSLDGDINIIHDYAFSNCTNLGVLFLTESIVNVSSTAFYNVNPDYSLTSSSCGLKIVYLARAGAATLSNDNYLIPTFCDLTIAKFLYLNRRFVLECNNVSDLSSYSGHVYDVISFGDLYGTFRVSFGEYSSWMPSNETRQRGLDGELVYIPGVG